MPISSHFPDPTATNATQRPGAQADLSIMLLMQQAASMDQQGQSAAAESLYRQALELQADHSDALIALGRIAVEAGRLAEGENLLGRAIALGVHDSALYFRRACARASLGRHREALRDFDLALHEHEQPDQLTAITRQRHRLASLHALHRDQRALAALDSLLACLATSETTPPMTRNGIDDTETHTENPLTAPRVSAGSPQERQEHTALLHLRGKILAALERPQEALVSYDQALRLTPEHLESTQDRATLLAALNRHEEAAAGFAAAVRIRPNMPEVHLDEGLSRLAAGDFLNGWKKYEWRWQTARLGKVRRSFEQPLWLGRQALAGKTILLHAEQGMEDTIQFCRYARRAAALGATVLLQAPAALVPLLSGLEGVAKVYAEGEVLAPFDYQCPLLSLPLAFGTTLPTIPISTCYLQARSELVEKWQWQLSGSPLLRVGLHWSDGRRRNDARSITLQKFLRLVYGRACYVCLQRDMPQADLALLEQHPEVRRVDHLLADPGEDLSDLAALIASLDLVITTESVVAHLAAAMGKPVWLLLSYRPGWRWMLERSDSPWYPSVRLFRQPAAHDWDSVVNMVARELDKWRA